jgi:glucose/arabinose dehydrogenase
VGWGSETPKVPQGLQVHALATGLQHPRSVYVLPNGDVLVVESNGPKAPIFRPKDLVTGVVETLAGAKAKDANRITLLRDTNGDGIPDVRTVFLDHLNSPFGVALVGHDLYVANTDAIMRYPYQDGQTSITAKGTKLTDLPGGPIDHHWTKSLLASPDGSKLYVGVGSNSNIAENGIQAEYERAAIWEVDRATGAHRIFASGTRNPTGLQWEPTTGKLWAIANERDEIGPDLVPDYLTSVQDGGFYGWPYSYYGQHLDPRVQPQRPDLVAKAIVPDYALSSTWLRSDLQCPPAMVCLRTMRAAPSSESMAAGIEHRSTVTRWSSYPSSKASLRVRRRTSSLASLMPTTTPMADLSASPWIAVVHF